VQILATVLAAIMYLEIPIENRTPTTVGTRTTPAFQKGRFEWAI